MATIKKASKGTCSPKPSNVSSKLGSPGKAKMGTLIPSKSSISKRLGTIKKAEKGTSLGMKSVKAGFDKNPGVTRADIIVAAKGQAKKGMKLKKQAATAIAMKKAGKAPKGGMMMMKTGGKMSKCKYGCK